MIFSHGSVLFGLVPWPIYFCKGEIYDGIRHNAGFQHKIAFQFNANFRDTFTIRFRNGPDFRGLFIKGDVGRKHGILGWSSTFFIF